MGDNVSLGDDVKIWHFCYIGDDSVIGSGTKIGSLTHVDYNVRIGRNCKIEGMTYIPPLTVIGDDVFVGPGVIFTNDPYPESEVMVGVRVEDGAIICAGAILRAGITVGAGSVVGMGAIVTKDIPSGKVVLGNPGRIRYETSEYIEKRRTWNESDPTASDNERRPSRPQRG